MVKSYYDRRAQIQTFPNRLELEFRSRQENDLAFNPIFLIVLVFRFCVSCLLQSFNIQSNNKFNNNIKHILNSKIAFAYITETREGEDFTLTRDSCLVGGDRVDVLIFVSFQRFSPSCRTFMSIIVSLIVLSSRFP